jgi:hypothetical protein
MGLVFVLLLVTCHYIRLLLLLLPTIHMYLEYNLHKYEYLCHGDRLLKAIQFTIGYTYAFTCR